MNGYVSKNFLSQDYVNFKRPLQQRQLQLTGTIDSVEYENINILNFKSHKKHLSIGHLNTQSMVSSFDEFHAMLQEHQFDILKLSETRLKVDVDLLKCVQIPDNKFSYKNRNEKRGRVSVYISKIEKVETYNLKQHITISTRKGTKIIYHTITTNLQENKLITTNVLPCPTVSDHDAPYTIKNISGMKFQTRTKYILNMKHFNIKDYIILKHCRYP